MKGAFRHQNIIIFLNSYLSLAHKTDSAKEVVVNNPCTFAQNFVTWGPDVQYHPNWTFWTV